MVVKGEIVLISFSGHRWEYPVEFIAQSDDSELDQQWRKPSNMLALAGLLAMLWTLLSMRDTIIHNKINKEKVSEITSNSQNENPVEETYQEVDSWGRTMD